MHEYGLAEGVLATVMRQRAGGRKVAGIRVRFGGEARRRRRIHGPGVQLRRRGYGGGRATIELVTVHEAPITCRDCGLDGAETGDVLTVCPRCAGEDVQITGGDEMTPGIDHLRAGGKPTGTAKGRPSARAPPG